MPEHGFWEYLVDEARRKQERKKAALYDQFMQAVYQGDSALIDELLANRKDDGYFDLNQNDGRALATLLDVGDYINAAKLLEAGAETTFTHERYVYDANDCYPYTTKTTDYISLLGDRHLTRDDVRLLAQAKQQNRPTP